MHSTKYFHNLLKKVSKLDENDSREFTDFIANNQKETAVCENMSDKELWRINEKQGGKK